MNKELYVQQKADEIEKLFRTGYNCAQAMLLCFAKESGMEEKTCCLLGASLGGGMGRLREVCGGASAMFLVCGMLQGYTEPTDDAGKKAHYARIQALGKEFAAQNGSLICRELLKDVKVTPGHEPQERTPEYYNTRPCVGILRRTAAIFAEYLWENGLVK